MEDLSGKVAWITGAGTGIGQAAALALARDGVRTILSGRRREPLEDTAAQIKDRNGIAEIAALDVGDVGAVQQAADGIVAKHERIDLLVNSAGINVTERHWDQVTPEHWNTVLSTNLDGCFYTIQAVLPYMRAQGSGLIVNVSSWAGRHNTYLSGPAYNASKHGLMAMNDHLNLAEGRNGIRACAICPGEVNTPILDKRPVPVPHEEKVRMLQSEDMGETILFVARMHPRVCFTEIQVQPTWNRHTVGLSKS